MNEINQERKSQLAELLAMPDNSHFRQMVKLINEAPPSDFEALVQQAEEGLEDWPDTLREVSLSRPSGELECPADTRCELRLWRSISHLVMKSKDVPAMLEILKRSTRITHLTLAGALGRGGLKNILELPQLASLRSLCVTRQSNANIKALIHATHLAQLRTLILDNCDMNAKMIALLQDTEHLHNIEELSLNYNKECGDEGFKALSENTRFTELQKLTLMATEATDVGMKTVFAQEAFGAISHLELQFNEGIGAASMQALADAPHWTALRLLGLSNTGIGDAGVQVLANTEHLRGIQALTLGGNQLTDASAEAISASPVFENLRYLDLTSNGITPVGLASLLDSPHLQQLKRLGIGANRELWDINTTNSQEPLRLQLNERGISLHMFGTLSIEDIL